ncbi:MAG: class I SAM-dependent methyltransferase [Desulfobulbaceae bacterium]|nr:class I SAM-dependent methyltransferase [Desulfobulbaceae bacterium]
MARKYGMQQVPSVVAELGPGDSLGIGLSALLSGAQKYYAFDVVNYADVQSNERILDELVKLFLKREPIPDHNEFPRLKPRLNNYDFPDDILTIESMAENLLQDRVEEIRKTIKNQGSKDKCIEYKTPWFDSSIIQRDDVDFIYSQAVLEHVDQMEGVYQSMNNWLKPGGYMSHQIDFKSHGLADQWYGHWQYEKWLWALIKGKRPYLLNRLPLSSHKKYLESNSFAVKHCAKHLEDAIAPREKLASDFQHLTDEDLVTSGAYILSSKY